MRATPLLLLLLLLVAPVSAQSDPIADLRSDDRQRRLNVFRLIQRMPPAERMPLLREALRVDDPVIRAQAASQMKQPGLDARAALPELIEALFDEDRNTRMHSLGALAQMGPACWRALPLVIEIAENEPELRYAAEQVLKRTGRPDFSDADPFADVEWWVLGHRAAAGDLDADSLRDAWRTGRTYVRFHVAAALTSMGSAGFELLAEFALDGDLRGRRRALAAIGRLASSTPEAVPLLVRAVNGKDGVSAQLAVGALATVDTPEAEAALLDAMAKEGAASPAFVVQELERAQPGAATPLLRRWFDSADERKRRLALECACGYSVDATAFVPELIQGLYAGFPSHRHLAAGALERHLKSAGSAAPFMRDRLAAGDQVTDPLLKRTLARMGDVQPLEDPFASESARSVLFDALAGDDWFRAGQAAKRLGLVGYQADAVLDALALALHHRSWFVRSRASDALLQFGAKGVRVHAAVFDTRDHDARWRAVYALGSLGPEAGDALPALIRLLSESEMGAAASIALERMGSAAAPAVPALLAALDDSDRYGWAADTLASIGAPAKAAVPRLIRDLSDPFLRLAAIPALRKFGEVGAGAAPALYRVAAESKSEEIILRTMVVHALAAMGDAGALHLARLGEVKLPRLGRESMDALSQMKRVPASALPVLWRVLRSKNDYAPARAGAILSRSEVWSELSFEQTLELLKLQPQLRKSLGKIWKDRPVEDLLRLLENEDESLRIVAAYALRDRAEDAAGAVDALARRLQADASYKVRGGCLAALEAIGSAEGLPGVVAARRTEKNRDNMKRMDVLITKWADREQLVALLGDESSVLRYRAVHALLEHEWTGPRVLEAALRLYADPKVRTTGIEKLIHAHGEAAIPAAFELMRSTDHRKVARGVTIVEGVGEAALAQLETASHDEDANLRYAILRPLEKLGERAEPIFLRMLHEDRSPRVRRHAITVWAGRGSKTASVIAPMLADPEEDVRDSAWRAMRNWADAHELAAQWLVTAMERPDARRESRQRILQCGEAGLKVLRASLAHADPENRYAAALVLAESGEYDEDVLLQAMRSKHPATRSEAITAISGMGADAERAEPILHWFLMADDPALVRLAARALGCLGPAGKPALDELMSLAIDSQAETRAAALVAATRIQHPAAVLLDLLQNSDGTMRNEVWRALASGRGASVPELVVLLEQGEGSVKSRAMNTLASFGPLARAALPALESLAKDPRLGENARRAIRSIRGK